MSDVMVILTLISTGAVIIFAVIGVHRWSTSRVTADTTFTRSLKTHSTSGNELTPQDDLGWMPPTYSTWLRLWTASGRLAAHRRSPGHIALTMVVIAAAFGVAVFPGGSIGAVMGLFGAGIFYAFLSLGASKRIAQMEKQLPLLLSGLRSQISAGVTPQTALIDITDSIPQPLGGEVAIIRSELITGVPLNTAMERFATRVPTRQVQFLVASIEIAASSGSDLQPQLIVIEDIYEQRSRIAGKIRSALALVKPTAWMAQAAPALALLWTISSDPAALTYFFGSGFFIFILGCALYAVGIIVVNTMMRSLAAKAL